MAGGAAGDDDDLITGINVTPLVDITLVLLIIFMVTTTYIVNPSIHVDLPKAATAEKTQPSTASVVITKTGALFLNGKETTEEALRAHCRAELAADKDLQVVVAADRDTRHGQVVHIVDVVKAAGVTKFAINTEPVDGRVSPRPAPETQ
jgi:biopolymer transport protein TolR